MLESKILNVHSNSIKDKLKCPNCQSENIMCLKLLMKDGSKKFRCIGCNTSFPNNKKEKIKKIYITYK